MLRAGVIAYPPYVIMAAQKRDFEYSQRAKQVGLLTSIPFALFVGPALGYFFGTILDRWCSSHPWGMLGGIFLGLIAGVKTVITLIRQAEKMEEQ